MPSRAMRRRLSCVPVRSWAAAPIRWAKRRKIAGGGEGGGAAAASQQCCKARASETRATLGGASSEPGAPRLSAVILRQAFEAERPTSSVNCRVGEPGSYHYS